MKILQDVWLRTMSDAGLDPGLALAVSGATWPLVQPLFSGAFAEHDSLGLVAIPAEADLAEDPSDMAWMTWPGIEPHWLRAIESVELAWSIACERRGGSRIVGIPRSLMFPHGLWQPTNMPLQVAPPQRVLSLAKQVTDPRLVAEDALTIWLHFGMPDTGWGVVDLLKDRSGAPLAMHAVEDGEIDDMFGRRLHPLPSGPFGVLWLRDAREPPSEEHRRALQTLWLQRLRALALALPTCVSVAALSADRDCDPGAWKNRLAAPLRRLSSLLRR